MSYSLMMVIRKNGKIDPIREFRNSWGFPAKIWSALSKRVFKDECVWLLNRDPIFQRSFWDLWKNQELPVHWRVAHAVTFDYAIISQASAKRVAQCLRDFSKETLDGHCVDHLPGIADELEKLPPDCIGACFYGNSVSENLWKPYDEEKDEQVDYDINSESKHFFVLESIELAESKAA